MASHCGRAAASCVRGFSGVAVAQSSVYGLDIASIDLEVSTRENFYQFANGGWLGETEIPDDKFSYGTFTELYDVTTDKLLAILAESNTGDRILPEGSDEAKAVRMWQQGIDTAADLGGIDTAYDALQNQIVDDAGAEDSTIIDPSGFTQEQRIFFAAATVWRGKIRDEALITRVRSGVHTPPEIRATRPLHNTDEFFLDSASSRRIRCTLLPPSGFESGKSAGSAIRRVEVLEAMKQGRVAATRPCFILDTCPLGRRG